MQRQKVEDMQVDIEVDIEEDIQEHKDKVEELVHHSKQAFELGTDHKEEGVVVLDTGHRKQVEVEEEVAAAFAVVVAIAIVAIVVLANQPVAAAAVNLAVVDTAVVDTVKDQNQQEVVELRDLVVRTEVVLP